MSGEKPTPNDFFSNRPPARILGSETEYNVVNFTGQDYDDICPMQPYVDRDVVQNGGRLYADKDVLEYATPECASPSELTRHEYAGSLLLAKLCEETGRPAAYRRAGYDHLVGEPASAGYHENYLIPMHNLGKQYERFIASYYATRPVWAGAGIVGKQFRLSQKAHGIGETSGGKVLQHGRKPMIKIKQDRQITADSWDRLEVRAADANMSPWVTTAKFAVTSLILRLTEHNLPTTGNNLIFQHPVAVLHETSRDLSLSKKYRTVRGTTITALEHQQALIETGLSLSDIIEVPIEERMYAHEVYNVCDELKQIDIQNGDLGNLASILDWSAKMQTMFTAGIMPNKINRANAYAVFRDLTWERLRPHRSVFPVAFRADAARRCLRNTQLTTYLKQPPDTRAKYRVSLGHRCDEYDPYGNQ